MLACALMYTLIQTARLNDIHRQAWLADVLARIADTPQTKLTELLPWNWSPRTLPQEGRITAAYPGGLLATFDTRDLCFYQCGSISKVLRTVARPYFKLPVVSCKSLKVLLFDSGDAVSQDAA